MINHYPNHWKVRSLAECAEVVSGVAKGRQLTGSVEMVPYLRVANVQDGYLDLSEIKHIQALSGEVERYRLQPGDVVLTEGGDHDKLGRGALWSGQIENCIHQNHIFRVRLNQEQVLPEFFVYYLGTTFARAYFLKCAKKTTNLASINMTQLKGLPVPVPPVEEQKHIVGTLNKGFQIRAKRREALALIEKVSIASYIKIFGDPITNLHKWTNATLKDVAAIARGRFSPRPRNDPQYYGGPHPFVQTGDIVRSGLYVHQHHQTLNDKGLAVSKKFPAGTIAITIAANIGETSILTYDTCFPDSVVGLKCDTSVVLPEFLRYQLLLSKARLIQRASQTAQKNINVEILNSFAVTVPPIREQLNFVTVVSKVSELHVDMKTQLISVNDLVLSLQQKAYSGGLQKREMLNV